MLSEIQFENRLLIDRDRNPLPRPDRKGLIFSRKLLFPLAVRTLRKLKLRSKKWNHIHFKMYAQDLQNANQLRISFVVLSRSATISLNFDNTATLKIYSKGHHKVDNSSLFFNVGENTLSFKGRVDFLAISYEKCGQDNGKFTSESETPRNSIDQALEFLQSSIIRQPGSKFSGNAHAIFDYEAQVFRMHNWVWSSAPLVTAFLQSALHTADHVRASRLKSSAISIGQFVASTQVKEGEVSGSYLSRFRFYPNRRFPFEPLYGPNDTAFLIKWAIIPLFEATGDERFLSSATTALSWLLGVVRRMPMVPSHYYGLSNEWEKSAFIDSAFLPEGFLAIAPYYPNQDELIEASRHFIDPLVERFRISGGVYGQHFNPRTGVTPNLFTRGMGWMLEGLLASFELSKDEQYLHLAEELGKTLVHSQNSDGSWNFLIGYGTPDHTGRYSSATGKCEKATCLLAYLFFRLASHSNELVWVNSGLSALRWCEANMEFQNGPGFGGISSSSFSSGITRMPFVKVATGYANAFYVLAKLHADGRA